MECCCCRWKREERRTKEKRHKTRGTRKIKVFQSGASTKRKQEAGMAGTKKMRCHRWQELSCEMRLVCEQSRKEGTGPNVQAGQSGKELAPRLTVENMNVGGSRQKFEETKETDENSRSKSMVGEKGNTAWEVRFEATNLGLFSRVHDVCSGRSQDLGDGVPSEKRLRVGLALAGGGEEVFLLLLAVCCLGEVEDLETKCGRLFYDGDRQCRQKREGALERRFAGEHFLFCVSGRQAGSSQAGKMGRSCQPTTQQASMTSGLRKFWQGSWRRPPSCSPWHLAGICYLAGGEKSFE